MEQSETKVGVRVTGSGVWVPAVVGGRRSGAGPHGRALFRLHTRRNGRDHGRRHIEGVGAVHDVVAARDPTEIRVDGPDVTAAGSRYRFHRQTSLVGSTGVTSRL